MKTPIQTIFIHGFSGGGGRPLTPLARELGLDMDLVELPDMPGFRIDDGELDADMLQDPIAYSRLVEEKIMALKKTKKIRLVAYSHGAIPAYLIASRNQDIVSQLVLIGPASSVRRTIKFLPQVTQGMTRILGVDRTINFMRNRMFVDLVTLYGRKRYWSHDILMTRLRTRREESKQYNRNMFYLMKQLVTFQSQCDDVRLDKVPTVILRITDDEIVGRDSIEWYRSHVDHLKIISTTGGHALVTVAPDKAAERLMSVFEELA